MAERVVTVEFSMGLSHFLSSCDPPSVYCEEGLECSEGVRSEQATTSSHSGKSCFQLTHYSFHIAMLRTSYKHVQNCLGPYEIRFFLLIIKYLLLLLIIIIKFQTKLCFIVLLFFLQKKQ